MTCLGAPVSRETGSLNNCLNVRVSRGPGIQRPWTRSSLDTSAPDCGRGRSGLADARTLPARADRRGLHETGQPQRFAPIWAGPPLVDPTHAIACGNCENLATQHRVVTDSEPADKAWGCNRELRKDLG